MARKIIYLITTILFAHSSIWSRDLTDSIPPLRPVFASYTLTSGSSHIADTYLSPIKYSGLTIGLGYERIQAMKFSPKKWLQQLQFSVQVQRTENMVRNAIMWYAGLKLSWGMLHRWKLPYGLSVGAGSSIGLDAGCLYLNRNGNNPASAKVAATLNASGYLAWNGAIAKLPITLRYQPTLPIVGAFFAPDYGELYYEIYLGNHSGLAHCAWWGNYFRLDHRITADIHFGSTALRIGYAGDIFSSKVNNIVTQMYTHTAIIGISGQWISVNPNKSLSPEARTISATY